jgi:phage-related protein
MALRRLQRGEQLPMPLSRPMPTIGKGCHELRIADIGPTEWRIIYHLAPEAIAILEVFQKKTKKTPNVVIRNCKRRLALFNEGVGP